MLSGSFLAAFWQLAGGAPLESYHVTSIND